MLPTLEDDVLARPGRGDAGGDDRSTPTTAGDPVLSGDHGTNFSGRRGRRPTGDYAAVSAIVAASALLNFWAMTSVGWGNAYYSAAVRSMGTGWKSFFFASLDSGNFVSVDKPPMSLWVQVISSKIFGYSQFSLLLPEALAGVAGVIVMYVGIRRSWGHRAGLAAAAALAVTPVFVAVNHTNVMDSVLVFFMTAAAVAGIEAVRRGKLRWLLLSCLLAGFAVTAKMAAALPVLPGLLIGYFWCAPLGWRTRIRHIAVAACVLAVASSWWFVAVWATPADARPYVGSTQKNSVFELAVERNGVNQVEGGAGVGGAGGRGGAGGGGIGGRPGRNAGPNFPNGNANGGGGPVNPPGLPGLPPVGAAPGNPGAGQSPQVGLFPPGVVPPVINGNGIGNGNGNGNGNGIGNGIGNGANRFPNLPQVGGRRGGFGGGGPGFGGGPGGGFGVGFAGGTAGPLRLLNADLGTQIGWFIPLALIGALGALIMVGLRGSKKLSALVIFGSWFAGAAVVFSITKGIIHPYYMSQLAPPGAALVGIGFGAWSDRSARRNAARLLWPVGLLATAFTQWTILRRVDWRPWLAYAAAGGAVLAGVGFAVATVIGVRRSGEAGRLGPKASGAALAAGVAAVLVAPLLWTQGSLAAGISGNLPYANPQAVSQGGRVGGGIAPNGGTTFATAETDPLVSFLRSQRRGEDWLVAVPSAGSAEPIIINTGEPVMALGGFVGSDPILTDEGLADLVAGGRVRFFLATDGGGGGPFSNGGHADWVTSNCSPVDPALYSGAGTGPAADGQATGRAFPGGPTAGNYSLYDCKPA